MFVFVISVMSLSVGHIIRVYSMDIHNIHSMWFMLIVSVNFGVFDCLMDFDLLEIN